MALSQNVPKMFQHYYALKLFQSISISIWQPSNITGIHYLVQHIHFFNHSNDSILGKFPQYVTTWKLKLYLNNFILLSFPYFPVGGRALVHLFNKIATIALSKIMMCFGLQIDEKSNFWLPEKSLSSLRRRENCWVIPKIKK